MDYEVFVRECDELIRAGKIPLVMEKIRALTLLQVPQKSRVSLAKICRRAGLIEQGLRLLYPIIRQENALEASANSLEVCEYAVLLSRNGSILEALTLLKAVPEVEAPEAMLYMGFCHVSNWNYPAAAVCFEKYLKTSADSYSKLIARVNLVAAYIANQRLDEAETLLSETVQLAESAGATRLVGNAYELRGQVAFFQNDFSKCRAELERASQILNSTGSYDQLLIYKWLFAMQAIEENSVQPLLQFREKAVAANHWESVRDTDFYRLKLAFEQSAFDHLLFGTPSMPYRQRILREIPELPSASYLFGTASGPQFDVRTGDLHGSQGELTGKKIHQMISILLKDFYAPQNMGTLFAELYPDEYFDINSSPQRVRQVLRRTRRWIESHQLPLVIQENRGGYKLFSIGDFGAKISFQSEKVDTLQAQWQKILIAFPQNPFSAEDAGTKLGVSRTTLHRLLTWALENRLLLKSGVNKSTRYQVETGKASTAA
jgi:tetratricopeptide (TPR) repeat protein